MNLFEEKDSKRFFDIYVETDIMKIEKKRRFL